MLITGNIPERERGGDTANDIGAEVSSPCASCPDRSVRRQGHLSPLLNLNTDTSTPAASPHACHQHIGSRRTALTQRFRSEVLRHDPWRRRSNALLSLASLSPPRRLVSCLIDSRRKVYCSAVTLTVNDRLLIWLNSLTRAAHLRWHRHRADRLSIPVVP